MEQKLSATRVIADLLKETSTTDELRGLIERCDAEVIGWGEYVAYRADAAGCSAEEVISRSGVTRATVRSWLDRGKLPSTRELFLRLAAALYMSVEETNHMLNRYGGYPSLYAKNTEDAIYIYVLSCLSAGTGDSAMRDRPYEYVQSLRRRVLEAAEALPKRRVRYERTTVMASALAAFRDDGEFVQFLIAHTDVLAAMPYWRLTRRLRDFLRNPAADLLPEGTDEMPDTVSSVIRMGLLPPKFGKIFSALSAQGKIPNRENLISIGISFNMTVDMLNLLLQSANMPPLYPRNREELALIYAVNSAHQRNPLLTYNMLESLYLGAEDIAMQNHAQTLISQMVEAFNAEDSDDLRAYLEDTSLPCPSVSECVSGLFTELGMESAAKKYCNAR